MVGLLVGLGPHLARGQSGRVAPPAASVECLLSWMDAQLNVREHGYNRGREVEAYQRVTGNHAGEEWCGSYQAAANKHCGLPFPAGAGGARNWFKPDNPRTFFIRGKRGSVDDIGPGDRVGFYSPSRGRICHIGAAIERTRNGFTTNEGNTGRLDKAGVHRLSRGRGEIYAASNWSYK